MWVWSIINSFYMKTKVFIFQSFNIIACLRHASGDLSLRQNSEFWVFDIITYQLCMKVTWEKNTLRLDDWSIKGTWQIEGLHKLAAHRRSNYPSSTASIMLRICQSYTFTKIRYLFSIQFRFSKFLKRDCFVKLVLVNAKI